jgi:hypothetical protein
VSDGVNVTLWLTVPTLCIVEGVVNAKVPLVLAIPPVKVLEAKVCPLVIMLAVGTTLMVGVTLATVTFTFVVVVL